MKSVASIRFCSKQNCGDIPAVSKSFSASSSREGSSMSWTSCPILGHAGQNEYLLVHIHCHVQAASATTDGALPFCIPLAVIWALCSSLPAGPQLQAVAPNVLLRQLRWRLSSTASLFLDTPAKEDPFYWPSML